MEIERKKVIGGSRIVDHVHGRLIFSVCARKCLYYIHARVVCAPRLGRTCDLSVYPGHLHLVTSRQREIRLALGKGVEVFDAEVKGALEGAKSALALPTAKFATDLWICLDNLEVATRLLFPFSGSSQAQFDKFLTLNPKWQDRSRPAHTRRCQIRVRWVPSHASIVGNEAADKSAKDGCQLPTPDDLAFTYAGLKRWAKESKTQASRNLWRNLLLQHLGYEKLGIISAPTRPKELALPRATLGRILAARSGHGDFADYHERFNHENASNYCRCGRRKAPLHCFFCHIAKRRSRLMQGPPSEMIPFILGTYEGGQRFGE